MDTTRRYSATEKAAMTLLTLGKSLASEVLQHLDENEVKRISRAFMVVSEVPREDQFVIGKEFHSMMKAGKPSSLTDANSLEKLSLMRSEKMPEKGFLNTLLEVGKNQSAKLLQTSLRKS